ncbi:MAG TPA: DUF2127 domain-containing protein [Candidatus Angelobacter sp.]|nr:DUF2127 domain-containing protein [Candidatus Angelobacter sp.]
MDTRKSLIAKHFGLRGVALFEASKGVIGLIFGGWLVSLRHKDLETVAMHLLYVLHKVLHLSPDGHIAHSIMRAAARVNHHNVHIWAILAFVYSAIRFTEATGLWLEKEWAEWFAVISGTLYTPYLTWELIRHQNIYTWGGFIINGLIVFYMIWLLRDSYKTRKSIEQAVKKEEVTPS